VKITIEELDRVVIINEDTGGDIDKAVCMVASALKALTFHELTIVHGFDAYVDEHRED